MLDQRDYMRGNYNRRSSGCIFAPGAVITLLLINIAVFLLFSAPGVAVVDNMSLKVIAFRDNPLNASYRLLTYMFLHGGFGHILFNMWGLYLFGSILEERIGTNRFYTLYFISGISGGLIWLLANWNTPIEIIDTIHGTFQIAKSCVGASGAIFGIIAATALFFPDMRIMLLFPPIPMKMKTFAFAYAAIEILFEMSGADGKVAHLAHLGGFIGGYAYIKFIYKDKVWGISSIFRKKAKHPLYNRNEYIFSTGENIVSQEELDRLLDKISQEGINSLSEEEMDTLRRAREEMNKQ